MPQADRFKPEFNGDCREYDEKEDAGGSQLVPEDVGGSQKQGGVENRIERKPGNQHAARPDIQTEQTGSHGLGYDIPTILVCSNESQVDKLVEVMERKTGTRKPCSLLNFPRTVGLSVLKEIPVNK